MLRTHCALIKEYLRHVVPQVCALLLVVECIAAVRPSHAETGTGNTSPLAGADTLEVIELARQCHLYSTINPDHALSLGMKGLNLSTALRYERGVALCYANLFTIYADRSDHIRAWDCIQKALNIYEKLHDVRGLGTCYNSIGAVYELQSQYAQALTFFHKALRINEQLNDKRRIAYSYSNIGLIHNKLKNYDLATEYYTKALHCGEELEDMRLLEYAYMNLGGLYAARGKSEQALNFFHQSMEVAKVLSDKKVIAYCCNHIGKIYHRRNEIPIAFEWFEKALKVQEEMGDRVSIAHVYCNMAELCIQDKNIRAAEEYATRALALAQQAGAVPVLGEAYLCLSQTAGMREDYREQLHYFKLHSAMKDSLHTEEEGRRMLAMEMDLVLDKREKEILILHEQTTNKELQLGLQKEKASNQRLVFSGVLLVIISASSAVYVRYQSKQREVLHRHRMQSKRDQLIAVINAQEKERIRFARDVHDGIGQYFTALKFKISSLELEDVMIRERNRRTYEEIEQLVDDLYHEIRNISFNIMPQVMELKGLVAAVEELIAKVHGMSGVKIELDAYNLEVRLSAYLEITIYRIIQELLNNITKYSGASHVHVQFTRHEGELNVMVEDDGEGYDIQVINGSGGHGWKNIRSRIEMLNGSVELDSQPGKTGTTVVINVPLDQMHNVENGNLEGSTGR